MRTEGKRLKAGGGYLILGLLFVISVAAEAALGPVLISFPKLLPQLWSYLQGSRDLDAVVVGAIRVPRLLTACMVGAGLALSGTVLQAIFRNPMADPAIIGISSGGSLGAVIVISLGLSGMNEWFTPLGAFISGLLVVLTIYRLGTTGGRTAIHTLLLSGVAVSSLCSAVTSLILSMSPLEMMKQMLFWMMGGLDGSSWHTVTIVSVFVGIGFCVLLYYADALDIISIGEEQAEGVGVHVQRMKYAAMIISGLMVGACVSVSGVIGFVGLIVPHLMRLWIGPVHRMLLPAAAIGGAALLMFSDLAARMLFLPIEINTGIVTSCLGAPFFLYLLRKQFTAQSRGGV